jgi:hypothetical protein
MKSRVLSLILAFAVIGGAVTVFTVSANAVVGGPCDTSNPPAGCRLGTHNANTPPDKPPPACAAIYFPPLPLAPLPPGTPYSDHQVGVYDSPPARIELRGESNGITINYYMLIGGKHIYDAMPPARLSAAAAKCVAAKSMPKPHCITSASPSMRGFCVGDCQGDGLMLVVSRAGNQRLALLYLKLTGGVTRIPHEDWGLCSAAAF